MRVLDVVDLHYYPQGKGIFENGGVAAPTRKRRSGAFARRARCGTPTTSTSRGSREKIRLIPRLKEIIAENYPGRGISIGEWDFGAEGHIAGALALAEVLGPLRSRRRHLGLLLDGAQAEFLPAYWAFRATAISTGMAAVLGPLRGNQRADELVAVRLERRSGQHLVAILLNFSHDNGLKAKIDLSSCGTVGLATRRSATTGQPGGFGEPKTASWTGGGVIEESVPPYSITCVRRVAGRRRP